MATQSVFFCTFTPLSSVGVENIVDNLSLYNVDNEDRFVLKENRDGYIDGYYVITYITKEMTYDYQTNEFIAVDMKKSLAIPFCIDTNNNLLDIWANKTNASKVITAIALSMNNQVIIEAIDISFSHVITRMQKARVHIGKIKLDNIVFEDNIIASCVFDLTNHETPYFVIDKYKKYIVQITAIFKNDNGEAVTVTVYSSGSIVIYKSKEDLPPEVLAKIKEICIDSGRA